MDYTCKNYIELTDHYYKSYNPTDFEILHPFKTGFNPFSAHERWAFLEAEKGGLVFSPIKDEHIFQKGQILRKDMNRVSADVVPDALGAMIGEQMGNLIDDNLDKSPTLDSFTMFNKVFPEGTLIMGSSKSETIQANLKPSVAHTDVMYGGDGADTLYSHWGNDVLIGGNGNDTLDGGNGNDKYLYWKGQGIDTIIDVGGNDELYLFGFSDNDKMTITSDNSYVYVNVNGETIIKINKKRGILSDATNSFVVFFRESNIHLQDWNQWKNLTKIRVACPTVVEVYDKNNNLVQILENESIDPIYTNYGSFYTTKEDGEFIKYAEIEEGYNVRIKAIDSGTMDFAAYRSDDNGYIIISKNNIKIEKNEEYTVTKTPDIGLVCTNNGMTETNDEIALENNNVIPATAINLSGGKYILDVGKSTKLKTSISPSNSTEVIQFESADLSVVEVDSFGMITGKKAGKTYIIAYTETGVTAIAEVTVKEKNNQESGPSENNEELFPIGIKVSSITINGLSHKIAAGKSVQLTAEISPADATNKSVTWTSSNTKFATVNASGKVSVKKAGAGKSVKITARANDGSGVTATYKITIMKDAVKSVKLSAANKTVKAGKSVKVKETVKTTGKKVNKALKWTSSNTDYATVNKSGKVKTTKAGKGKTVTITAQATDGSGKKAKIKIKIK